MDVGSKFRQGNGIYVSPLIFIVLPAGRSENSAKLHWNLMQFKFKYISAQSKLIQLIVNLNDLSTSFWCFSGVKFIYANFRN